MTEVNNVEVPLIELDKVDIDWAKIQPKQEEPGRWSFTVKNRIMVGKLLLNSLKA